MNAAAPGPLVEVLPLLKSHDWPGAADGPCEPLIRVATARPIPWITWGWDRPALFRFASRAELAATSLDVVAAIARANLVRQPVTRQPLTVPVPGGGELRMIGLGGMFAAEKILDRALLLGLAGELGADLLAVGIPRRGMLLATRGDQPPRMLHAFSAGVEGQFRRAESPPITPTVFGVLRGGVEAVVDTDPPRRLAWWVAGGLAATLVAALLAAVAIGPAPRPARIDVPAAALRPPPIEFGTSTRREVRDPSTGRVEVQVFGDGRDFGQARAAALAAAIGALEGLPADATVRALVPTRFDTPANAAALREDEALIARIHAEQGRPDALRIGFADP